MLHSHNKLQLNCIFSIQLFFAHVQAYIHDSPQTPTVQICLSLIQSNKWILLVRLLRVAFDSEHILISSMSLEDIIFACLCHVVYPDLRGIQMKMQNVNTMSANIWS